MERRGPDEGGGREERRTSLTDSEVEDEVYSECLVSLSPGGGGGAALLPGALRHLQPRSPYTRDHRRRSAGKRQAPQPPSRPSPTTTPAPAPTPSPDTTPTPSLRPTPTSSPVPTPTPSPTPVTTVQMVLDSGVPSQSFTHLVSHPVLAPLGPATPTRSASSLTAARNLRIRLIDDDSDSESHLSDSFEEHIVFPRPGPAPGPPLVSQVVVTSTQVMTQTHLDLTSSSPPTRPPPAPTPLQVSSPGMPPPAPRAPGVVCRGRTRRLVHSSSDPGLPRHLRFQPPRSPSLAAAWPLDQVSEEEGEDGVGAGRGGLERSDSTVTVATLQEELLVAPRLKLRVTLTNITALVLVTALAAPHATILLYTSFRLVFGTLFPAYYSYKAVKTKNVKEYVKWMMYWIVFAFFTCFETLTDLFVSFWFPFYYELKILVVLWLLSPATRGSSILYRKFVHPWLARREEDIDQCIAQARQQGYSTVVQLGTKGVNYATTVLMQTAIKGGGGLMNQLRRSYSQSELVGEEGGDMNRNVKALPPHYPQDHYASDYSLDHHTHTSGGQYELERRGRAESDAAYKPRGSSANRGIRSTKTRSADVTEVYYQDVPDEGSMRRRSPRTHDPGSRVLSADDLTSGYSSGDPDPADLISADVRGRPRPDPQDTVGPMPETEQPRGLGKVRRTQSLSASTLSLHRTSKRGGGEAGRPGLRSGRGSGAADDPGAPHASYSGQGQPSGHHGAGFRRSRPGEVSAYATLPRAAGKRTAAAAAAKKRQV